MRMFKSISAAMCLAALLPLSAFASKTINVSNSNSAKLQAHWISTGKSDVWQAVNNTDTSMNFYIHLQKTDYKGVSLTGIYIEGCGTVKHVQAGTGLYCSVAPHQQVRWASDSDKLSQGEYEII